MMGYFERKADMTAIKIRADNEWELAELEKEKRREKK